MKKVIINICKKVWIAVALLVIAAAIFVTIARMMTPVIAKHVFEVETFVSKVVHMPVKIGKVEATWHFMQPMFRLDHVKFYSKKQQKSSMTVSRVFIGIDIIKSIMQRQFEPGILIISDASLSVKEDKQGHFTLIGINNNNFANNHLSMAQALQWLSAQRRIAFQNIVVGIKRPNGEKVDALLNVSFKRNNTHIRAQGYLTIAHGKLTTKLKFVMNAHGNPSKLRRYRAHFYLEGNNFNLSKWLQGYSYKSMTVTHGDTNFQVWGKIKQGKLKNVNIKFGLNNFSLHSSKTKKTIKLKRASGEVVLNAHKSGGFILTSNQLKVITTKPWPLEEINLNVTKDKDYQLYIKYLPIEAIRVLLTFNPVLPKELNNFLKHTKPTGTIQHLKLGVSLAENKLTLKDYDFSVNKLGWQAWKKIPGVTSLAIKVRGDLTRTKINAYGHNLSLSIPRLYEKPLALTSLTLNALVENKGTKSQLLLQDVTLKTKNDAASIHGKISFDKEKSPQIDLASAIKSHHVTPQSLKEFLPSKLLNQQFVHWMDNAVKPGGKLDGQLLWRGALDTFPYDDKSGTFFIKAAFKQLNFQFHSHWPTVRNMDGSIEFSQRRLAIIANKAESLGNQLDNVTAIMPYIGRAHPIILTVNGNAHGPLAAGRDYVMHSPIKTIVGKDFSQIKFTGPAKFKLSLRVPLAHHPKDDEISYNGTLRLANNSVAFPFSKHLKINKLGGQLLISQHGVKSKNITAAIMDSQAAIDLFSHHSKAKPSLEISVNSKTDAVELSKLVNYPIEQFAKGAFDYQAKVNYTNTGDIKLSLKSDLKGVAFNLPKPFSKEKIDRLPMNISLHDIKGHQYLLGFNIGSVVAGKLLYDKTKQAIKFTKGHVHFGVSEIGLPVSHKLIIDGDIHYMSLKGWIDFLSHYHAKKNTGDALNFILKNLQITVAKVNVYDEMFNHVLFGVDPQKDQVIVTVKGADIDGTMYFPLNWDERLEMQFSKLYLMPSKKSMSDFVVMLPKKLPPMIINCADFRYGDRAFGNVGFKTTRTDNGLSIDKFVAFNKYYVLNAKGSWTAKGGKQQTHVVGTVSSTDVSNALKQWQFPKNFHNDDANINVNLVWPGSPIAFSTKHLQGLLSLRFGSGYIDGLSKSADAKVGFGRLLNLLSIQSLPRRLTLNFRDLTHKGFYFDKFRGDFDIKDGNATTNNTYINGSVAYIAINGGIDLYNKIYHLRLFIAPNLTSSIPIVATIAGGPIVGGVAWIINKMVTPEVQRIAHYTYLVSGTWDKPVIKNVKG